MRPIQIYGLMCPIAKVVRYVGKSVNAPKRFSAHIRRAERHITDHHAARWIRSVLAAGLRPELVILHDIAPGERWQDVERQFIADAEAKGWRLTNTTKGGEGLDYINPEDAAEYLANLSAAMKAIWSTPERREENRLRCVEAWANPEVTARRLKSMQEAAQRPDVKARLALAMAEVHARPEVKAKRSATVSANWANPDIGPRQRAAIQGASEKMSASAVAKWQDPEKRAALMTVQSSPESRAKKSAAAIARSTPEYRALQAERTRKSWETRNRVVGPPSEATRAKIGAAQVGKQRGPQSEEHRAAISESVSRSWDTRRQKSGQGDLSL